jgi:nicotinate dehydrogenase subunit B
VRSAIAPVTRPDPSIYTAATLERGRQLAAVGNCVGCHTAPDGVPNAGGHAMPTPFGTVYGTNLTPDVETGIGAWSFSAFQRAMREGISRDGHRLYPAFPYTAFTQVTDDDLMALYAYLMSQEPVRNEVLRTKLAFPFNVRPLLAVWNGLHLTPGPVGQYNASRSAEWNRGAYLVNGLGHCGACHTERNALGAERDGGAFLAGAVVNGWEAPALTAGSRAPVPWTQGELYRYLRHGHSPLHGAAAGPMAPVVRELGALPDTDVQAMAHYLASFNAKVTDDEARAAAQAAIAAGQAAAVQVGAAQRMFTSACAACHHDGDGPRVLGVNTPLALDTNLHSDRPDNLLRVILEGVREPAGRDVGFMPAFKDSLDDRQIADLAAYMRQRYAPAQPPWRDLAREVARLRREPANP